MKSSINMKELKIMPTIITNKFRLNNAEQFRIIFKTNEVYYPDKTTTFTATRPDEEQITNN